MPGLMQNSSEPGNANIIGRQTMVNKVKDEQRAVIDGLIDWYEKFKPLPKGVGRRIPTKYTKEQLRAILNKSLEDMPVSEYSYRGHTILARGVTP
jgi:hypothetical protein